VALCVEFAQDHVEDLIVRTTNFPCLTPERVNQTFHRDFAPKQIFHRDSKSSNARIIL